MRRTAALAGVAGALACAQASANPFTFGPIDPSSPVAADVRAAEHAPGPYPKFSTVPAPPKDVRPVSAWREAVYDTWALKKKTEADAAAIPFTLTGKDTSAWVSQQLAKIPSSETAPPAADAAAQSEAFAAAKRARATPPPPSN
jgi:hypothetical protein